MWLTVVLVGVGWERGAVVGGLSGDVVVLSSPVLLHLLVDLNQGRQLRTRVPSTPPTRQRQHEPPSSSYVSRLAVALNVLLPLPVVVRPHESVQ